MGWFTEDDLRAAAGEASFRRGRDYVDAVGDVAPTALGVRACVRGGTSYEVWLGRSGERLVGECSCPYAADGNFCKHCVAVGLVVLGSPAEPDRDADLGGYLASLSHRELVDLLLEQAGRDPVLYRKLTLLAARVSGAPQVAVLRRRLDEALRVRGYLDERATRAYAHRARDVLDTVEELVTGGHAAEARPLARAAVEGITAAMPAMDDVDGVVVAACRRAYALYAKACAAARPEPARLAEWIFRQKLDGPGWPTLDLADFAGALGESGLRTYRSLVREAWRAADPGTAPVVRAMREQLAEVDGDLDAHVDILAEDVPNPKAFLDIVGLLRSAGQLAGAIRWGERGVEESGDPRVVDALVECLLADGRPAEAVAVRLAVLREAPTRTAYAALRGTATGTGGWPEVRDAALDLLDGGELVGALLDDGEVAAAWEAAEKYGCADGVWLEVARAHGRDRPGQVLAGYRRVITGCLSRTGRDAYREVGVLLEELREVARRCDESAGFAEFVAELRTRHARRRVLLAELDRRGL